MGDIRYVMEALNTALESKERLYEYECKTTEKLREENAAANARIVELEAMLEELKAKVARLEDEF